MYLPVRRKSFLTVLAACLVLLLRMAASAAPLTVEKGEKAPPAEVSDSVRAILTKEVVCLKTGEGPAFEFWFRDAIPVAAGKSGPDAIKEGTMLGVVQVHQPRRDFKDNEITKGVYTLRIGLQPQDGNHMGTSPFATFALLIPANLDKDANAVMDHDQLAKLSMEGTPEKHPRNLNLQPVESPEGEFPRLGDGAEGAKNLLLKLPAKAEGSNENTTIALGVVYEGTGHL
ncbi:MAG: hypothetical protein HY706_15840 [Candidatus Hydrogenedentes bacterium]|nr:hypothetical protein [Candidatus Hydrogenedentota bacterium]